MSEPVIAVDELVRLQNDREAALYAAQRITIGDDRWSTTDLIEFAEYIRAGTIPETPEWARRAAGVS